MFLKFKAEKVTVEQVFRTIDLKKVWQVTKSEWYGKWAVRLDIYNNYVIVVSRLTGEEADDIEYKIIQGMMSKEDGVLELT